MIEEYGWLLDDPITQITESINGLLLEKFDLDSKVDDETVKDIILKDAFKTYVHKINDVEMKNLRILSWAFRCYFDRIRFYSHLLKNSVNKIELYEHSDIVQIITTHLSKSGKTDWDQGNIRSLIAQHFTQEEFKQIRAKRDEILLQTDKYALVDYPFKSDAHKNMWFAYRQELRDLPEKVADNPYDVSWPTAPHDINSA